MQELVSELLLKVDFVVAACDLPSLIFLSDPKRGVHPTLCGGHRELGSEVSDVTVKGRQGGGDHS